jgi:hypothetical protein
MARFSLILAFSSVLLAGAGCSDDGSDPDTFCCAIKQICSLCDCESRPELVRIANAGDGEACRFVLEENVLGCGLLGEEGAIANCVDR